MKLVIFRYHQNPRLAHHNTLEFIEPRPIAKDEKDKGAIANSEPKQLGQEDTSSRNQFSR